MSERQDAYLTNRDPGDEATPSPSDNPVLYWQKRALMVLTAERARVAALVEAGDAMAAMITDLGEDMLWNEHETVTAWRAAKLGREG